MTIEQYLEQWEGYTADEVANILRWKGMKGTPCSTSWCPINRDIKKETGRLDTNFFGEYAEVYALTGPKKIPAPQSLDEFAFLFDHGRYQDLVDDR